MSRGAGSPNDSSEFLRNYERKKAWKSLNHQFLAIFLILVGSRDAP